MVATHLAEGVIDWNKPGAVLSVQEKQFYEKNGYLIVRKCVPQYELDRYKKRFELICNSPRADFPMITVMKDVTLTKTHVPIGTKMVTKIQNWQDDDVLFDFCRYPGVVSVVRDLIGTPTSNLCSMHTMMINKPPDTGSLSSRHPLHQDLQYFPFRPADFIACAWTAMEPITRKNGCLVVVPGTHKGHLHEHAYPPWEVNNKAYHGIQDYDPSVPLTYAEMEAGDTIFFHPLIIHGSGANRSEGNRLAISCHYANDDLCQYHDEQTASQKETDKEVTEMLMKKLNAMDIDLEGRTADMQLVWKLKARSVNGARANL